MIPHLFSFLASRPRDEDLPQKIPDPDATKPEGWLDDGLLEIVDPDASKPSDWLVLC